MGEQLVARVAVVVGVSHNEVAAFGTDLRAQIGGAVGIVVRSGVTPSALTLLKNALVCESKM
jgi:hypothetical protein